MLKVIYIKKTKLVFKGKKDSIKKTLEWITIFTNNTSYILIDFIRFILVSGNGKEKIINKTIMLKKIDIISVIFF